MRRLCLECAVVIPVTSGSRCAAHQAAFEARQSARSNAEFGGSGGRWQSIRREVYERQEGRCARCGNELEGYFEVDHVVPRAAFRAGEAAGDPSALSNLQAVHPGCHAEIEGSRRQAAKRRRSG